MSSSIGEKLQIILNILFIAGAGFLLYRNYTKKISHSGKKVGHITFKRRVAERKYAAHVVWEAVERNTPLFNYDTIKTAQDSQATIKLNDGTKINLEEDTLILLNYTPKGMKIKFTRGSISAIGVSADKKHVPVVRIESGKTSIFLGKATVQLEKTGKDKVRLSVLKGKVKLKLGKKQQTVSTNQSVELNKNKVEIRKISLIPITPLPAEVFLTSADKQLVRFSWKINNKKSTIFEISRHRQFKQVITRIRTRSTSTAFKLAPGSYYWRVRPTQDGGFVMSARGIIIKHVTAPMSVSPAAGRHYSYLKTNPLISFTWMHNCPGVFYTLEIASDPTMKQVLRRLRTKEQLASIDSLNKGSFYWRVRADFRYGSKTASVASRILSFSISKLQKPDRPNLIFPGRNEKLTLHYLSEKPLVFSWQTATGADKYHLIIGRSSSLGSKIVNTKVVRNFFTLHRRLQPGTYYWRVQSLTGERVRSGWTALRAFLVTKVVPLHLFSPISGAYLDLSQNGGRAGFYWRDPNNGSMYRFQLATDKKFTRIVAAGKTTRRSYWVRTLREGRYYWRIWLLDKKGIILKGSSIATFQAVASPSVPIALYPGGYRTVNMTHIDRLFFSWKKSKGKISYRIRLYRVYGGWRKLKYQALVYGSNHSLYELYRLDKGLFCWELSALKKMPSGKILESKSSKNFFRIYLQKIKKPKKFKLTIIKNTVGNK